MSRRLLIMLGIVALASFPGCDTRKDPIDDIGSNYGLVPLSLGNFWNYVVEEQKFDCRTTHPACQAILDGCTSGCDNRRASCQGDCEEARAARDAVCNDDPACLIDSATLYADCVGRCSADKNTCYANCRAEFEALSCEERLCIDGQRKSLCLIGGEDGVPCTVLPLTIRQLTDRVSQAPLGGDSSQGMVYATANNVFRVNRQGGFYQIGARGQMYPRAVLEFAYPAQRGETYNFEHPEKGTYHVTVDSLNELTIVPAGRFICYRYSFELVGLECGCRELRTYWVAPGIGIIQMRANYYRRIEANGKTSFFNSYVFQLQSYQAK